MSDYKKRIEQAMSRYYERQEPQEIEPKRTNSAPEKEVEAAVLVWCKQMQWDVETVEAKAKFNVTTGRYTGRAASAGLSDIIGNTNRVGHALLPLPVFIELKSPGRRIGSALRDNQRAFLTRKITYGCFAIMCDSVDYLNSTWLKFLPMDHEDRVKFLLNELPQHNPRQMKLDF